MEGEGRRRREGKMREKGGRKEGTRRENREEVTSWTWGSY